MRGFVGGTVSETLKMEDARAVRPRTECRPTRSRRRQMASVVSCVSLKQSTAALYFGVVQNSLYITQLRCKLCQSETEYSCTVFRCCAKFSVTQLHCKLRQSETDYNS